MIPQKNFAMESFEFNMISQNEQTIKKYKAELQTNCCFEN